MTEVGLRPYEQFRRLPIRKKLGAYARMVIPVAMDALTNNGETSMRTTRKATRMLMKLGVRYDPASLERVGLRNNQEEREE
jgi:hypothetical protein